MQSDSEKLLGAQLNNNTTNFTSEQTSGADLSSNSEDPYKKKLIRETNWRWLMLAAGCFFLMGSYFCFDNPAPLKDFLEQPPYNLTPTQWSALYSIYSFPNMVLPLFGGIFIDRVGVR